MVRLASRYFDSIRSSGKRVPSLMAFRGIKQKRESRTWQSQDAGPTYLVFFPFGTNSKVYHCIRREITARAEGSSGNITGKSLVRTVRSPTRLTIVLTGQPHAL